MTSCRLLRAMPWVALVPVLCATAGAVAWAQTAGLVQFTVGGPLHAMDLNTNFTAIEGQIAGLPALVSPPGIVVAFAGANAPTGWLLCNGSSVLRGNYPALFGAIGTSYGAVDATHFNLPDYRGYFLRGLDPNGRVDPDVLSRQSLNGGNAGALVGSLEADDFASHAHGVSDPGHSHALTGPTLGAAATGSAGGFPTNTETTQATAASLTGISINSAGGSETRPRNIAVQYIIKT